MTQQKDNLTIQKLTVWLIRNRWVLLVLALLWLIPAAMYSQQLKLERSIESLYAKNNPHLLDFQQSKKNFGGDEFVIVAFEDPHLITKVHEEGGEEEEEEEGFEEEEFEEGEVNESDDEDEEEEIYEELSPASYRRIKELSKQLQNVQGVRANSTQDLAQATTPKEIAFQIFGKERKITAVIPNEKLFPLVEGMLIGKDHKTTAIVMRLEPESTSTISRSETIHRIREVARNFEKTSHLKTYIVGEPVQVHDMFHYVEEDGRTLFYISLGLLAAVIFILFRNIRWMLLPLLVVLLAVFSTEALLVLSHLRLSMVSSLLNSLVTIISIATVTHITVRFREHLQTEERIDAFSRTLTELLPAIFWTCSTTALGFLVLMSSDITPVKSFGLMMAIATLFVLCATAISLPGGALLGSKQYRLGNAPAEGQLSGLLTFLNQTIEKRPRLIGVLFFVVMLIGCGGLFRLEVETDFSKNFRSSSPIVQSLDFVETNLGGAGTWEVNFPAPQKLTKSYLDKVKRLAIKLRNDVNQPDNIQLTKVLCMTDGLDPMPRLLNVKNRLIALNQVQPEFGTALYNAQAKRMRIMLRSKERQPAAVKLKLIQKVHQISQEWAETELADDYPNAHVQTTGLFVLLAYLVDNLLHDQLISFILAAVGIVMMMMIAFRHFKIGIISLIPNLFPIILVVGGMGWVGLPINIATAMIASVSLGLTIDSSIHYISEFQRAKRFLSVQDALNQTQQRIGRAMVFSNIALIIGFSVLTFSHFIPLVYFGILVSLAMLGGLAGNLILLPLLLKWAVKNDKKGTTPA